LRKIDIGVNIIYIRGVCATTPGRYDELRTQVREMLDRHLTDEVRRSVAATGTYHDRAFARGLGARGWIMPGWPRDEGGAGLTPTEQAVLEEELQFADAPIDGIGTTRMVTQCIRVWGHEQMRRDLLAGATAGELLFALGYTEAEAGSDVASVRTKATRDGDGWRINGEKIFTTLAHEADYIFLLTLTDSTAPRRAGLTLFLVPTSSAGFQVTPIATLSGERTNTTVYDHIRLPDTARVGEVNRGWEVLGTALELEHAVGFGAALARVVELAAPDLAGTRGAAEALAAASIDAEVARLLQREAAARGSADHAIGPMAKLFSSEALARHTGRLLDLFGSRGLSRSDRATPSVADVDLAYRHSQVTRIFAGTSEIQRSIIAERGLGLPRSRRI
jgi:alkylation response protein AidB-like acyl-CoA dehydrogenase